MVENRAQMDDDGVLDGVMYGDEPPFMDGDLLDRADLFYGHPGYDDPVTMISREGAVTPELMISGDPGEYGAFNGEYEVRLTLSLLSSNSTFSQPFKEKCISEVVRIGSVIIFHPIKLWKAKFFTLCDGLLLVRLQGKFVFNPFTPKFKKYNLPTFLKSKVGVW